MNQDHTMASSAPPQPGLAASPVPTLRPPRRWHDPLRLIEVGAPERGARVVLSIVCLLVLLTLVWAACGRLDVIASAEGRLAPQTLVKIVQPVEAGVVRELLVAEGDSVTAGQVLVRLDPTLARADKAGVANDLAAQQMQARRIAAELAGAPMLPRAADDPLLFAQVRREFEMHRQAYLDSLEQQGSVLAKSEHEARSAREILAKLEQTLPSYQAAAQSLAELSREGYVPSRQSADKQREATEKARDLDAQASTVAAALAAVSAERRKLAQLQSVYKSELEKEMAQVNARIQQLGPTLEKSNYREGQMALRAPQDGVIKDLATTTVGAVVQPGAVVLTLVPKGEKLYADVNIKNEDVGFVQPGQRAQVKLAAYPFQRHGMLSGKVIQLSADASEPGKNAGAAAADASAPPVAATYKARVELDQQTLVDAQGRKLPLVAGMQAVVEIQQGQRTVLDYLLSPVQKSIAEAARER
jgi:hemolysin D